MEETIKDLLRVMPLRKVRRNIRKNLKTQYVAGAITKSEYKSAKNKLKVLVRGFQNG